MWVVHIISEGICQYVQTYNVTIKCYYTYCWTLHLQPTFPDEKQNSQKNMQCKMKSSGQLSNVLNEPSNEDSDRVQADRKQHIQKKQKVQSSPDKLYSNVERPGG